MITTRIHQLLHELEERGTKMTVTRQMLKYQYSKTRTNGDGPWTGLDATFFHRHEEYEVIPMLQQVVNALGLTTIPQLHALEDCIQNDLPGNVRSRKNVFQWLVSNSQS